MSANICRKLTGFEKITNENNYYACSKRKRSVLLPSTRRQLNILNNLENKQIYVNKRYTFNTTLKGVRNEIRHYINLSAKYLRVSRRILRFPGSV